MERRKIEADLEKMVATDGKICLRVHKKGRRMPMSRRMILILMFLLSLIVTLHSYLLDGLDGAALAMMYREETRYADGYSDSAFRKIRKGMLMNDVQELIGVPLAKVTLDNSSVSWVYSESPFDSHYRVRSLIFKDQAVIRVEHEFYVD